MHKFNTTGVEVILSLVTPTFLIACSITYRTFSIVNFIKKFPCHMNDTDDRGEILVKSSRMLTGQWQATACVNLSTVAVGKHSFGLVPRLLGGLGMRLTALVSFPGS